TEFLLQNFYYRIFTIEYLLQNIYYRIFTTEYLLQNFYYRIFTTEFLLQSCHPDEGGSPHVKCAHPRQDRASDMSGKVLLLRHVHDVLVRKCLLLKDLRHRQYPGLDAAHGELLPQVAALEAKQAVAILLAFPAYAQQRLDPAPYRA